MNGETAEQLTSKDLYLSKFNSNEIRHESNNSNLHKNVGLMAGSINETMNSFRMNGQNISPTETKLAVSSQIQQQVKREGLIRTNRSFNLQK
jgi:hypothetical protein